MSAKSSFLSEERKSIEQSVTMVDALLARESMSQYEVIALGTLLQNIYTGIESIVRYRLQEQGHKIKRLKTGTKNFFLRQRKTIISRNHNLKICLNCSSSDTCMCMGMAICWMRNGYGNWPAPYMRFAMNF